MWWRIALLHPIAIPFSVDYMLFAVQTLEPTPRCWSKCHDAKRTNESKNGSLFSCFFFLRSISFCSLYVDLDVCLEFWLILLLSFRLHLHFSSRFGWNVWQMNYCSISIVVLQKIESDVLIWPSVWTSQTDEEQKSQFFMLPRCKATTTRIGL